MSDVSVEGFDLAPGVVDTIIAMAAADVEGIASVGQSSTRGLKSLVGKRPGRDFDLTVNEDNSVSVCIHVDVCYGVVLPTVAQKLREVLAEALETQLGVTVKDVDVCIDGIVFDR